MKGSGDGLALRKHKYKKQLQEHKEWLRTEISKHEIAIAKSSPTHPGWRYHVGALESLRAALKQITTVEKENQEIDEQLKAARNRDRQRRRKAEAKVRGDGEAD